jgi:putative endonuclease
MVAAGAARVMYVYITASRSRTLYVGVTGDLVRRVPEHKGKVVPGFTDRYDIDRLVYFEEYSSPRDAIAREKQIKGRRRSKKIALIETANADWCDLSDGWYDDGGQGPSQTGRGAVGQ